MENSGKQIDVSSTTNSSVNATNPALKRGSNGTTNEEKKPKIVLPNGEERGLLTARNKQLDLDRAVGKKKMITDASMESETGGFWCETCKCSMKDSISWLDHINGKKHQRRLGNLLRVEHVDVSSVFDLTNCHMKVKEKFQKLKQEGGKKLSAREIYLQRQKEKKEAEEVVRPYKNAKKYSYRKEEESEEEDESTKQLKAMMGFGGFTSK